MAAEAYSLAEEIKRLDFELVTLKGSNISAPTSLQLETQIQDLEFAVYELCFATYANDEKLIAAYNQMIHFKRIVDRLEPQVLEFQGVLKINKSLKKEVDELQRVCIGLLEKNEQLKGEKDELEVSRPSLVLWKTFSFLLLRLPLAK